MYKKKSKQYKTSDNIHKNSVKSRRSSLQVNLSYTMDLSDSDDTDSSHNKNTSKLSIKNDISCVLANISDKDEALSKNCSRLRDAILNKTRELFDKENDVRQMTTKILSSQSMPHNKQYKLNDGNKNLHDIKTNNSIILSPRKTRASTMRERLNSFIASSNSQMIIDDSVNDITNIGSPILCSTYNDRHCNIHESCNIKKCIDNNIDNVNIAEKFIPKLEINGVQETRPILNKRKPSIRNIQACNIKLDDIDGFRQLNKSKILQQVSMELTKVHGNCILNESSLHDKIINDINHTPTTSRDNSVTTSKVNLSMKKFDNLIDNITNDKCEKNNCSMHVNTSLDKLSDCNRKSIDAVDEESNYNVEKNCDNYDFDISLIQRLRNISHSNRKEKCITPIQNNKNNASPGVIEGTPIAITRSMLLRSQAKLNSLPEATKSQSKNHPSESNTAINTVELEKTIILDNIPTRGNNQALIIIEESNDELSEITELNNDVNTKREIKSTIGKKKLFTQRDTSGLASLSPLSNDICTPQVPKSKRLKRRRIKRNVAGRIINANTTIGKSQCYPQTQIILTSSSASSQDYEKVRDFEKSRKKKRMVKSKKIIVKKHLRRDYLNVIKECQERSLDDSARMSPSPNVFRSTKRIPIKRKYGNHRIVIVSTGLSIGNKYIVRDAVKNLGGAIMESSVTRKTTHVVTTGVRTINLLRGIIRGCWLIKIDWIKKSIEAGKWISAEKYKIQHFSKAVEENRRDREIFGDSYVSDLFATCGLIHVQNNTSPPNDILNELIKTAGGLITEVKKKAKIIIGNDGIKENWILDSITTGELRPIELYKRKKEK